ncbi:MAG: hypothetical protein ACHQ2Z_12635, partial [Elusimicrobiota bacterium]
KTPSTAAAASGGASGARVAAARAACLVVGLIPGPFARAAARAAATLAPLAPPEAAAAVDGILAPLTAVGALGAGVFCLAGLFWVLRRGLLRTRGVETQPTWGCGFSRPSPSMQYTASSYTQPLAVVFQGLSTRAVEAQPPLGYWPERADFRSRTPDPVLDRTLSPAAALVDRSLAVVRRVQHGHLQYYLLYVLVFLIGVLVWKL